MAENKKPFNIPYQGINPYLDDNISELNSPSSFKDGLTLSYITDSTEYGGASEGIIETYQLNNIALQKSTTLKNGRQVIQSRIGFSLPDEPSYRPNYLNYSASDPVPFLDPGDFVTKNILNVNAPDPTNSYYMVDGALRVDHFQGASWNTSFILMNRFGVGDWSVTVEYRNIHFLPNSGGFSFAGVGVWDGGSHLAFSGLMYNNPGLSIYGAYGSPSIPGFETWTGPDTGPVAMRTYYQGSTVYFQYKAPGEADFTTYYTLGPVEGSSYRPAISIAMNSADGVWAEISKFTAEADTWTVGDEPTFVPAFGGGWSDFVARGREFWISKNNNFNADVNRKYLVDTSSAVVECIVLSSNLELGDSIEIKDYADTFDINLCRVSFDGVPFESDSAGEYVLDWKGAAVELVYTGTDIGWKRVKE